jgi:galactose oxidase
VLPSVAPHVLVLHAAGPAVTVGIDGVCPYGIGACWGGAHEALRAMSGVAAVDPVPDQVDSTATVRLAGPGLPPLDLWDAEFHRLANGSYQLRGFEVRLSGVLADGPVLAADGDRPEVGLVPLDTPVQKRAASVDERAAYARLGAPGRSVAVTGPVASVDGRYVLQVRIVERT